MKSLTSTIATFASLTLTLATPLGAQPALDEVEQKIEQAQQQVEKVQQKIEQAQQRAEKHRAKAEQAFALAQAAAEPGEPPEPPEPPEVALALDNGGNDFVYSLFGTPGRNAAPPLIVRSSNTDPTVLSNIQEDLTVMSRLLNKNLDGKSGRDKRDSAMGIVLSAMPSSRRPQSVYLEGYGALFMVNVKFPLVATSAKEEEKSDKPGDTAWEETKRELYGPRERAGLFGAQDSPAPEYDSGKVEDLKKDILESLKNATNIRNLKPEESIVVAVTGSGGESGPVVRAKRFNKAKTTFGGAPHVVAMATGNENPRQQTTLTIRVKKSDVDDYAKGKLGFAEFQKKAAISAY